MAWDGWWSYGGSEFINTQRTAEYARRNGAGWLRCGPCTDDLAAMLGHALYQSPLIDDAPWVDTDDPASFGFWGLWPLDISGPENSTRTGTITESLDDGGVIGRVRNATRPVVFNTLLLAADDCSADYGARWLRQLLLGSPCGPRATQTCAGDDLCYLSCCPQMHWGDGSDDPMDCLTPYLRNLRNVVFNNGPTVMTKQEASDGSAIWNVQFTGVAGNPWEFGAEKPIVEGFLKSKQPYVVDPPGKWTTSDLTVTEASCKTPTWQPPVNPKCPDTVAAPGVPNVKLGCFTVPANWRRRQFTIPKEHIPHWGEVVPRIEIHATKGVVENLRLRFYSDPEGNGRIAEDPCAYCGDIVFSYIPQGHTMVFDAADQVVYLSDPGGSRRRADGLVYKTDGTPFEWPALTCGFGYIVAVDLPQYPAVNPVIDLSLYQRAA